jgi:hypothetical protein
MLTVPLGLKRKKLLSCPPAHNAKVTNGARRVTGMNPLGAKPITPE